LDKFETELHSDMQKAELYRLKEELYYSIDEKQHQADLSEKGRTTLRPDSPDAFVLPDLATEFSDLDKDTSFTPEKREETKREAQQRYAVISEEIHAISQLLRAYSLYERDVEYVVQDGKVMIVDENTGRVMPGRRWSDGLHQAIEAKENVTIERETRTYATITIQNYFRMYEKLAGMTGTAETEETEFHQIYKLDVAVVPTNQPCIRDDRHDLVFKTRREKYNAIQDEVRRLHELGYPVLVGTASVEVSETLSRMFKRGGLTHNVLNAKYHQREAEIVAFAGQPGAITIATNMAGRGTDIKLGPGVTPSRPSQVKDLDGKLVDVEEIGGLHIVGSERHESRRIDRQLRGRSGRQGDPGASQFFLSLEDDLMRLFGSDRIARLMDRMGAQEGEVLTHPLITRSIEKAQKRVELQNFQARKRLLDYDDVMNQQREVIYSLRSFALDGGEELRGEALKMVERAMDKRIRDLLAEFEEETQWDYALLRQELLMHYLLVVPELEGDDPPAAIDGIVQAAVVAANKAFVVKEATLDEVRDENGMGFSSRLLSLVMLNVLDEKWKDHLYDLDQLRSAIHYRSWGQKDPLIEYKQEAYTMFVDLMADIHTTFTERFLRAQLVFNAPPPPPPPAATDGDGGPKPKRRYDALGVLEDVPADEPAVASASPVEGQRAGGESARPAPRQNPTVVGAGRARKLSDFEKAKAVGGKGGGVDGATDWSAVGRNDPCPCGSGKKYKKCHGA
ncbi:MAG TPA: SEC-C metal-binding domain-containing protein, partial [Gemmatimonadaceae bacterium]